MQRILARFCLYRVPPVSHPCICRLAVVTDQVTASTTGLLTGLNDGYCLELIRRFAPDCECKLPPLLPANVSAGQLVDDAAANLGLLSGIPVFHGCGDAGATTLGAGAGAEGQAYLYLGTSGWLAATEKRDDFERVVAAPACRPRPGVVCLSHPLDSSLEIAALACMTAGGVSEHNRVPF